MSKNFNNHELLLKCLQGKADEQEYEYAYKWINSDKSNLAYYQGICNMWISTGIITNNNKHNCNKAWRRIARRTGIQWINIPKINSGWKNIAAVFFIAFTLGAFGYLIFYSKNQIFIEREYIVQAPLGSKAYLILPDSTKIWLNAGSTLKYSTHYDITNRSVYLSGEAYFNVESNSELPFRVHAHDIVINALGTEFNVKAYPEDDAVSTTLVEGNVMVEIQHINDRKLTYNLEPRQNFTYHKTDMSVDRTEIIEVIKEEDEFLPEVVLEEKPDVPKASIYVRNNIRPELYTSWKDEVWVIEGKTMADMAVMLGRRYNTRINIHTDELKTYRFTGKIMNETLEQVLQILRMTTPLKYSVGKGNVDWEIDPELKRKYDLLL